MRLGLALGYWGRGPDTAHVPLAQEAERLGVEFLGAVPLHMEIREKSDSGRPVVVSDPDGPHAKIFRDIAEKVWAEIGRNRESAVRQAPKIVIES